MAWWSRPLKDKNGKVAGALSAAQDITERKLDEQSLKMSEERFRMLSETSPDYIVQTDKSGNIKYASPASSQIVGYTPKELINHNYSDFIPLQSLSSTQNLLGRALNGVVRNVETEILHKNGKAIAVEASIAPYVENGEVISLFAVIRDITERKQAEAENKILRDKAEMSSRLAAVGEMAAGIAHEINNPLTSVVGFSEILMDRTDLSSDIKDELKMIADGSHRMKDIVRRMLTFARQTKPVKANFNINGLIDATLDLRAMS